MFTKSCKLYPLTIVMMGMILSVFLAAPICYAGGAVRLVPADDRDVPEGSFIPERRITEIETEVKKFKAEMKEKAKKQEQELLPQNESPKSESPKEK